MNKIFFPAFILLFFLVSCSSDDTTELSDENNILTFSFLTKDNTRLTSDVNGIVDQQNKTILVNLPEKIDITELKPSIMISENATISPDNLAVRDYSTPVTYEVKAQNESVQSYRVTVTVPKSDAKQMVSWGFMALDNEPLSVDIEAIIDEVNQTISIEVPFGVSLSALVPTLVISPYAEVQPKNKTSVDFSNGSTYTITAEDGTTQTYTVTVTNAPLTDRDVLIDWYNLNPSNTLGWDFAKEIDEWEGITVSGERVEQINIQDKGLPTMTPLIEYLTELNSLILVSNEITSIPKQIEGLKKLRVLNLTDNLLENLPSEIGNLTSLQSLILHNNKIETLPGEIGNLEDLIQLNLDFNDLKSLPTTLGQLAKLQSLSVYGSRQLANIPAEIGDLTKLINLNLGWCNLSTVPSTLGDLVNLVDLRLDENKLQEVPKEIGNLSNLKTLQLQKNTLSQLPSELGMLDSLLVLFIQENQITALPEALCELIAQNNVSLNKDASAVCP